MINRDGFIAIMLVCVYICICLVYACLFAAGLHDNLCKHIETHSGDRFGSWLRNIRDQ